MRKLKWLVLFLSVSLNLLAQEASNKSPTIRLTGFSENLGFAAFKSNAPTHLGGAIAIAFPRKQREIYRSYNTFEVGYFKHAPLFQAAYAAWKPTYEWHFKNGLQLHGIVGLGYLHALPTEQTYVHENGTYQAKTNFGKPSVMASLGMGIGYQLNRQSNTPTTIFVRQEWALLAPFNLYKDLPGSLNTMLSVGVSFSPFKK